MSSHIIHVIVELDDQWGDELYAPAVARIAENIAEEVENNWGQHGAFAVENYPMPYVTGVQAIP